MCLSPRGFTCHTHQPPNPLAELSSSREIYTLSSSSTTSIIMMWELKNDRLSIFFSNIKFHVLNYIYQFIFYVQRELKFEESHERQWEIIVYQSSNWIDYNFNFLERLFLLESHMTTTPFQQKKLFTAEIEKKIRINLHSFRHYIKTPETAHKTSIKH